MELIITIVSFVSTLTPFQAILTIAVLILFLSQGWLTFQGFKFRKESRKKPTACLHGRAGACELLRRQMEIAEVYLQKVVTAALDHYLDERARRKGEDVILATDIEAFCYDLTLYRVSRNIKNEIRSFFAANHLAEMDESEFELYMKRRTDQIIVTMTSLMDKLYYPGSDPSRRELYEYNQTKLMPIFHSAMEATLRQGRHLAIQFAAGDLDKYMERSDEHN